MRMRIRTLLRGGVSQKNIGMMIRANPAMLIGIISGKMKICR